MVPLRSLTIAALCLGCLQDPNDPKIWAERLQDGLRQEEALDRLSSMPVEKARAVLPQLIDLYRETGKPHHLAALARYQDPRARPLFVEALDRWRLDRERAVVAAQAFGEARARDMVDPLLAVVGAPLPRSDPGNLVRLEALRALSRIGDPRMVPTLIALLDTPTGRQDFRLHQRAALELTRVADARAIPALVKGLFLARGGQTTFEECRLALARIGPAAIPTLLELMGDDEALGPVIARRGLEVKGPWEVRHAAARLLGDLRAAQAVRPMAAYLRKGAQPPDGPAIVTALGLIGTAEAVDPLLALLRDAHAPQDMRIAAAQALALSGDEFAAPVLFDLVAARAKRDVPPPWLRHQAVAPLVRVLGPDRAGDFRTLLDEQQVAPQYREALAAMAVAEACGADLACYARHLDDPSVPRAEKAAWALALSGDPAAIPPLLGKLGFVSDLPAARYPVYRAALHGLTRLADRGCQPCREQLRKHIAVDDKLVHEPREKELLRETRIALALIEHRPPRARPGSPPDPSGP